MRNLQLATQLRRLRRHASNLTPDLARLTDAVGDTVSAATSVATATANDTARRLSRKVGRQRERSHKRVLTLLALAGTGIVIAVLARRPSTERSSAVRSPFGDTRPAPWSPADSVEERSAQAPNDSALVDLAAAATAPSTT